MVIQGVRRCGKSTLLSQMPERIGLDPARCLFVNFEDRRLANQLDHRTLDRLVAAYESTVGAGEAAYFFDEIQHVDGWQAWLRTELDTSSTRRFVLTDSNAHLLSGEIGSALTGRHLRLELFPFSFGEYRLAKRSATMEHYLLEGGLPAPLLTDEGDRLLRACFNDIVERDVRERVGARSSRLLRQLAQLLFESAGSEISIRRCAGTIGMSVDTTSLYLEALEDAYLVFGCPCFAYSERKRAARGKKYYPVDPGMRRACVSSGSDDRGKALECAAYVRLRQTFGDVFYWRGRGVVDFVVLQNGRPTPIQVTWDRPKERHPKSLEAFYEDHPLANEGVIFTAQDVRNESGLPADLGRVGLPGRSSRGERAHRRASAPRPHRRARVTRCVAHGHRHPERDRCRQWAGKHELERRRGHRRHLAEREEERRVDRDSEQRRAEALQIAEAVRVSDVEDERPGGRDLQRHGR
ncbi:MAG: ATP-binding protein [Planctomycetota bacterium]|nr:ATP-binding protein [Planctomycetota bacterium]MDA0932814.1 ATP-binding protein [Planctomycetota bacterium]